MRIIKKLKENQKKLLFIEGKDKEISLHPLGAWGPSYIIKNEDQKNELSDSMSTFKLIFLIATFVIIILSYKFGNYICPYLIGHDRALVVWPILFLYIPGIIFWLNRRLSHLEKQSYFKGATKFLEHIADHNINQKKLMTGFIFLPCLILLTFIADTILQPEDHYHYYLLFVIAPVLILGLLNRFYMVMYKLGKNH